MLVLPLGTAGFTIAVTLWSAALGLATSPLYSWALGDAGDTVRVLDDPGIEYASLRMAAGIVLVPVAAWGCRAVAAGSGRLARTVLG